jgi:hypothetical protein
MPILASITIPPGMFPWEVLLYLASYVVLEIATLIIKKRFFSVIVTEHIIEVIMRVAKEVFEKDVNGKKLCGILLALALFVIFLAIVYGFHGIFTHADAKKPIVTCALIVGCSIPIILLYGMLNESYISWVTKSRSHT